MLVLILTEMKDETSVRVKKKTRKSEKLFENNYTQKELLVELWNTLSESETKGHAIL